MKCVYIAANLPDAQLLHDLLEQAGIPAHVFNANAMGALGELPLAAASPQVWIAQPHQEAHARSVIAGYQQRGPALALRVCDGCAESNPGEFDLCWNCGQSLAA